MTFPSTPTEFYISVDVETSGPNPGLYSMLSIGACTLDESRQVFYVEMKPDKPGFEPEAVRISQLSLERLAAEGMEPTQAMQRFADWVAQCTPTGSTPLFLGFNSPFDWMFVCDYFQRFLGLNPFGHTAIDIKSFYMGLFGTTWLETSMSFIAPRFLDVRRLTHNALQDAIDQAAIFKQLLMESKRLSKQ